ncbi:hypothetical protein H4582DRAFT_1253 [Lactarius indigo]|nr:hypothetical protein H4582DRAFT_1253 [Lactarius indigo]
MLYSFVSPLPVALIFPICQSSFQHHCQVITFERLTGHDTSFTLVRSAAVTETTTSMPLVIQCVGLLHASSGMWYCIIHTSKMRAHKWGSTPTPLADPELLVFSLQQTLTTSRDLCHLDLF